MGRIIKESILDHAKNNFSGNIHHPSLITLLCIKGGIKVAEDEEKSPKAFPLTPTGVLKTPTKGEEVERIKKRRRTEEQPKETVLVVEAEEEFVNEKRGSFEDYIEQLVLFPTTVEEIATHLSQLNIEVSRELKPKRAVVLNC